LDTYRSVYKNGKTVFVENNGRIEISIFWLEDKMNEFGFQIDTFSYLPYAINLYGAYPKLQSVDIKKFFYDNYPYVILVETKRYGFRINFSKKVRVVYNSDLD
jgi:hypothetical protein